MVDAGRRMLDVVDGKRGERGGVQGWGGCLMQAGGRLWFGLGGGGSRTCRAGDGGTSTLAAEDRRRGRVSSSGHDEE